MQQQKIKENKIDKIYWAKLREDAILPTKRDEDAGYDLYICSDKKEYILKPNQFILLPTGIVSAFSKEYCGQIWERSSTGSKCMSVRMGIIDSGYRNEWFIGINNTSNKTIIITDNPKQWEAQNMFYNNKDYVLHLFEKAIAQVTFIKLADLKNNNEFISIAELENITSKRKTGVLGSSGK